MRQRLGVWATYVLTSLEEERVVARCLQHFLRAKPTTILVASTRAPAGPDDVIGQAMVRVGCHIERFLAPVALGNLLLLGYKDDVPVVSAPGYFRSAKANVVDLVLPPVLARYRVSGWEIACLRHGGLNSIKLLHSHRWQPPSYLWALLSRVPDQHPALFCVPSMFDSLGVKVPLTT